MYGHERSEEKKMIIEIRAAAGGDDAKLLVEDLAKIYEKASERL